MDQNKFSKIDKGFFTPLIIVEAKLVVFIGFGFISNRFPSFTAYEPIFRQPVPSSRNTNIT